MTKTVFALAGASLIVIAGTATPAYAGDTPLYAPTPDWVVEKPVPKVADGNADADFAFLLADRQTRMQGGMVESYSAYAYRVNNASLLAQFGTLSSNWNPEKGDFTVHRVALIRDGKTIDLVDGGQKFTVLRREANLENYSLDGVLTATMQMEGMAVGDVVVFESSTSYRDTSLGGNMNDIESLLTDKVDVTSAGLRFVWPTDTKIRWKAPDIADAKLTTKGDMTELVVINVAVEQPDMPSDAPTRYRLTPMVEVSSFPDWQSVSRTASEAYVPRAVIADGTPLAKVVAGIAAKDKDPLARTAAALRIVQDDVRYLFKGMENGNYTPQKPEDTWSLRYGDCKAKSLLLATMLRRLGVDADVVLVNSTYGDALPQRLPGFAVFDHVIVRATIDGKDYWLDGTKVGDRAGDLADTPGFAYALPILAEGSALVPIPVRPLGRPSHSVAIAYDSSAGINLPALFDVTISWRTSNDNGLKTSKGIATDAEFKKSIDEVIDGTVSNIGIYDRQVSFDEAADITTIRAKGARWLDWDRIDGRYESAFDSALGYAKLSANRAKPEWRGIDVAIASLANNRYDTSMVLPGEGGGFAMVGRGKIDERVAGSQFVQNASLTDGVFSADENWRTVAREIPVAALPAERRKLASAKADPLRIEAPTDNPGTHVEAMLAAKGKRLDKVMAALDAAIADAPKDEVAPLRSRAYMYELTQRYKDGIADLDSVIDTDPTAENYLWRAGLYAHVDRDKALEDIANARGIEPDSLDALTQLIDMRIDAKEYDQALADIDEGEGLGIERKSVAGLRARALAAAGRGEESLLAIENAGRRAQSSPELLVSRCLVEARYALAEGRVVADCTRAIQLNPEPTTSLIDRAIAYRRLGRAADAIADIDAALDIDPDLARAWYMKAVLAGGKNGEAELGFTYAAYIDPDVSDDFAQLKIAQR